MQICELRRIVVRGLETWKHARTVTPPVELPGIRGTDIVIYCWLDWYPFQDLVA
jgi:hypothetical protein